MGDVSGMESLTPPLYISISPASGHPLSGRFTIHVEIFDASFQPVKAKDRNLTATSFSKLYWILSTVETPFAPESPNLDLESINPHSESRQHKLR